MRLIRNTRTFFFATLLGTALLVKADHNVSENDDGILETAEIEPQRGGPDPAMEEVCARR